MSGSIRLSTSSAACRACHAVFTTPREPEAPSMFLARGEKGTAFAAIDALDCPAWDFIAEVVDGLNGGEQSRRAAEGFLRIVGRCVDPVDGQAMVLGGGPVCPACGSREVAQDEGGTAGQREVAPASFAAFMILDVPSRIEHIKRLWREWKEFGAIDV
jgi:RNA polymerase subunit RPABC4/transcription elongation factor Spt4